MQLRLPIHPIPHVAHQPGVSIELWSSIAASARSAASEDSSWSGFPDDRAAPKPKGTEHGRGH